MKIGALPTFAGVGTSLPRSPDCEPSRRPYISRPGCGSSASRCAGRTRSGQCAGGLAVRRAVDPPAEAGRLPNIDIPVVIVVWNYPGLSAEDMERRVVFISERAYSTTVNGIERIESQSIPGIGILQGLLRAGRRHRRRHRADQRRCAARSLRITAAGHDAARRSSSSTPRTCRSRSSRSRATRLTEQELFDYGLNFIRVAALHHPRPVDAGALRRQAARRSSSTSTPRAVAAPAALAAATSSTRCWPVERHPARRARRASATTEYNVLDQLAARRASTEFDAMPIKVVERRAGAARRRRRTCTTASPPDQHRARQRPARDLPGDPQEADASTLAVVDAARDALPGDQGGRARGAGAEASTSTSRCSCARPISGVLREARHLRRSLVSLMILVFLGSWRSDGHRLHLDPARHLRRHRRPLR